MKKFLYVLLLLLFLSHPGILFAEQIKIVVSIHPLSDLVKNVGKDKIIVRTLLPPAASPHTFEPTPKQMVELYDSQAFIKAGAGLEFWAERVVQAVSNKKLLTVDLSQDMPLIRDMANHEHKHIHAKGIGDPHFWLDPVLAKKIVDRIAYTLTKIDPANKKFYTANADTYKKELSILDQEIAQTTSRFKTKGYVTFHPAWNYFSKRYGLNVIGVIEESPGREPSPGNVAKIINELKRTHSRVVFAEPQFNPKIAEAIAKEAGAKVLFLDPIGAYNAPDRDTYIKLMRYNVSQMERAMR